MHTAEMGGPMRVEHEVRVAHGAEPQWSRDGAQGRPQRPFHKGPLAGFLRRPLHLLQHLPEGRRLDLLLKKGMGREAVLEHSVEQPPSASFRSAPTGGSGRKVPSRETRCSLGSNFRPSALSWSVRMP